MSSQDMFAAVSFAITWHKDQKRKYTNEPYVLHPIAVAQHLEKLGCNSNMVYAALFHDLVEDTDCTLELIEEKFGARVAQLVEMVTDVSVSGVGNRKTRKALDRAHLANADAEAQGIKCADIIDNTHSIIENDLEFAKVYIPEMVELLKVLTKAPTFLRHSAIVAVIEAQQKLELFNNWKE